MAQPTAETFSSNVVLSPAPIQSASPSSNPSSQDLPSPTSRLPETNSSVSQARSTISSATSTSLAVALSSEELITRTDTKQSPLPGASTTTSITEATSSIIAEASSQSPSPANTGAIVGGIIGGLGLILLVALAAYFLRRFRLSLRTRTWEPWQKAELPAGFIGSRSSRWSPSVKHYRAYKNGPIELHGYQPAELE
ncbi:MAG: hypothetical protein Q9227_000596 [Pyrenula ochraceoflavens]